MKSIYNILTQLQADLAADLPSWLTTAGLDALDNYVIGGSRNPKEKALCIYKDTFREDDTRRDLSLIFQAQLTGVDEETGAKYEDVITKYLKNYEPSEIGMNIFEGIQVETFGIDNSQGIIIIFTVQYSEPLDGCDE